MRLHRFFFPAFNAEQSYVVTDPELLNQWLRVFRMQKGDEVILCNGRNQEGLAVLRDIEKKQIVLEVRRVQDCRTELPQPVALAFALLKRENVEWIVQKATELGVTRMIPLRTDRTVKQEVKLARMQAIAKEAMEQSGRGIIPVIEEIQELNPFLIQQKSTLFSFDSEGKAWSPSLVPVDGPITLLIGPEGGWSPEEKALFEKASVTTISLGPRVLRAETAAIAALTLAVTSVQMKSDQLR